METKFTTLFPGSEMYPPLLNEIADPPKRLFVAGAPLPKTVPMVAIVGTRKATTRGKELAKRMAQELASHGIAIVSGLALGMDTAAHEGALAAGGRTIAVVATGLDTVYPARNKDLAGRILRAGGSLLSEYEAGVPALPHQFIQRNRIISGLSLAAIVIECPERSGSLATARFALEQGREVMVVPGPAGDPNYKGSHMLLRDGARLVTSAADVLEDLGMDCATESERTAQPPRLALPATGPEAAIIEALMQAGMPLEVDKLDELTKLGARTVNAALAVLVTQSMVKETERGYTI